MLSNWHTSMFWVLAQAWFSSCPLKPVQPISSIQPANPAEVRIEQVIFYWIGTMSTAQPINSRRSLTGWWRVLLLAVVLLGSLAGFAWWLIILGVSTENPTSLAM